MPLTPEEKTRRARDRMLEKAREVSPSTYARRSVANVFQKMIRAEAATDTRPYVTAVVGGEIRQVQRDRGQVVCVTCGRVGRWDDAKVMNTGHFLAGRSNSILFEATNVAPQCVQCNCYQSGAQVEYQQWMEFVHGREEIQRLRRRKAESVSFSRFELVHMRMEFMRRLKLAENALKQS